MVFEPGDDLSPLSNLDFLESSVRKCLCLLTQDVNHKSLTANLMGESDTPLSLASVLMYSTRDFVYIPKIPLYVPLAWNTITKKKWGKGADGGDIDSRVGNPYMGGCGGVVLGYPLVLLIYLDVVFLYHYITPLLAQQTYIILLKCSF
ncbi:unnamed protein product [Lepeophtheirus salmonis]|uniref:(salmon louse) hypothetical protein n=1 Tax=Lepeophtheirus salmonis TaxID=72036 RepID=A0A7R8CEX0_LEPSM|nr:unnamed protein product [Lepeophtheirus salmonis]CAF2799327.1 unnamed protein product [Lepeophtheirus salmonis]